MLKQPQKPIWSQQSDRWETLLFNNVEYVQHSITTFLKNGQCKPQKLNLTLLLIIFGLKMDNYNLVFNQSVRFSLKQARQNRKVSENTKFKKKLPM